MRRISIILLFGALGFYGCGEGIEIEETVSVQTSSERTEKVSFTAFEGESDDFHPDSEIESIRKKKLTDFGRQKLLPPVLTPDKESAQKAIDIPDVMQWFVLELKTKSITLPAYPFDYENDIGMLKRLYASHNLDKIIQEDMSELDKLKALMKYVYEFMDGGSEPAPDNDIGPSAEIITKLRREQGIGGTSRHYAALFCQLALSCGFNPRLVGMHTLDGNREPVTHTVCEVYLNNHNKWAVFDAFQRATYYERNGIPQSALELRNVMLNQNYRILHTYSGVGDFSDVVSVRERLLPRYRFIYMWRMNDILSKSPGGGSIPWQALYQVHLVWEDEHSPVGEGAFDKLAMFNDVSNPEYPLAGVRYVAHDTSDFEWQLNYVGINLERTGLRDFYLYFDTVTPNFKNFEIFDGDILYSSDNKYKLENLGSRFIVRSINQFEIIGPNSELTMMPGDT